MGSKVRGIAHVDFIGISSLECLSDYAHRVLLRDIVGDVDQGAISLRPWDPAGAPAGNGYTADLYDKATETILATGSCVQLGNRATGTLTVTAIADTETVTITYPIRADESAALTTATRVYRFLDTPVQADDLQRDAASVANMLDSLAKAINGTAGYASPTVFPGTNSCGELVAYRATATTLVLEARDGGSWGNGVTTQTSATASWTAAALTGGTGQGGVEVRFTGASLPLSLLQSNRSTRHLHIDCFGLDSANNPTKLITGPASTHRSGATLPLVTP